MTTPQNMATKPNRLFEEKSPYLLQHAYNPVDWYAWGEKPFAAARRENKPVFLSIGYSTCHWCHVMEKESFENEAIAEILNRHFISIKVDREERPDIDQLYMIATQAMTGGGGWPMSVFLFPDKKPFYAGTYFPPEPRLNHPGFPELLNSILRAWRENRDALAESAEKVTTYLKNFTNIAPADAEDSIWAESGYQALLESYDQMFYGFGTTNKFPRPSCLSFLHTYARIAKDEKAFVMARQTLQAMALGGMYDHIGGGFHRYSVDRQWRIPHFEKMLYDQAQLIISYLEMYQQTEDDFFAEVAEETIEYVLRDLHHPEGGLYSAEDADSINPYDESKHGEGAFYLWKESEIREVLSSEDADYFITGYNIRKNGNALEDPAGEFSGRNILYREKTLTEMAKASDSSAEELRSQLTACKKALLQRRNHRPRPHLDNKIITAWNGLMLSALALAGRILGSSKYLAEAERVAQFLMDNLMVGTMLQRRWCDGEARFDGVLEDYAFVIQGMLDLHEATHRANYLTTAISLTEKQITLFADPSGGFFGSQESSDLPARIKESYDGAEPSGNSVSAINLLRLGRRLNKPEWIEMAAQTIRSFGKVLEAQGLAMPMMLKALLLSQEAPAQLVIAGRRGEEDTEAMLACVNTFFLPQLQIVLADGRDNGEMLAEIYDFYHEIEKIEGKATAYLCKDFSCGTPTNNPVQLVEQLKQLRHKPVEK